ncbi:Tetratricopeptide-like helical [Metarhizium rileyi]|uniref:Mitochondrial fission 1 protein n=1 Tax=Metarhizium rileyi (strain RCEF 4871) TaxID=1649241 RepID=A0A166W2J1_METRR|nr:Tetratricopeptide-like helical [Metarhizium rileyi RCEF 4871]
MAQQPRDRNLHVHISSSNLGAPISQALAKWSPNYPMLSTQRRQLLLSRGALRTITSVRFSHTSPRSLSPSELQVLRAQYEKEGDMVGVQTKFNYAWGLVKSNNRNDQQLGVRLLSDIFRLSPERRRECLFYLALGNYKLGNYGEARRYNDLLLDKEPANLQASDLRQLIDNKVAKEGLMGVAILSGISIAAGVVGAFLFKNARKR